MFVRYASSAKVFVLNNIMLNTIDLSLVVYRLNVLNERDPARTANISLPLRTFSAVALLRLVLLFFLFLLRREPILRGHNPA